MIYGWNSGPDDPRQGQAATHDRMEHPDPPECGPSGDGPGYEMPDGLASPVRSYQAAGDLADGHYKVVSHQAPSHQAPRHQAPRHQALNHQALNHQALSHQPLNDQPLNHQPSFPSLGYQSAGQADIVTYGRKSDRSDAGDRSLQQAGPAAAGRARAGLAGQPENGYPEFALSSPPESKPRAAARGKARRRATRRRCWPRVWLGVGGGLVVAVAATAVLAGRAGHAGHPVRSATPSHPLTTPQQIGTYTLDQQVEKQFGLSHGEQYLTQIDPGHVFGMVAGIYDTGGPASTPNRVAVIAGRLVNSLLADVIKSFTQQEAAEGNAPMAAAAGPLGGKAACAGKDGSGMCVWADRDTVGVLVSATVSASSLARVMLTIRSGIELPPA